MTADGFTAAVVPRVSVIVPAFNCEEYLGTALDSVLAQDGPALEVIVVDDGSTDGTQDIAERFVAAAPGTVSLHRQANAGSAAARNRGLEAARGTLIAFLDADDYWFPGKLEAEVGYLDSHPDIGIVCSRWLLWHEGDPAPADSDDHGGEPATDLQGWLYDRLFLDCEVWTSTVLIRRQVIDAVGAFDTSLRRGQDYDYWLRAARVTPMARLARATAVYRIHGSSVTRTPHRENYEYRVLHKNAPRRGSRAAPRSGLARRTVRGRLADAWRNYWYQQYASGAVLNCARAALQMIRWTPWRRAAWVAAVRTVALPITRTARRAR